MLKQLVLRAALHFATWCVIASSAFATPVVGFLPSHRDIGLGETRTVAFQIAGVFPPKLGAFDVFIAFDPSIVTFDSGASSFGGSLLGDQLACPGLPATCTEFGSVGEIRLFSPGVLELFEVSLAPSDVIDGNQAVTFSLAELAFSGLAKGLTDLTVDLSASVFADSLGNDIPVTATKGELHVAPEPSALGLVLVALSGIVVLRSGIRSRR